MAGREELPIVSKWKEELGPRDAVLFAEHVVWPAVNYFYGDEFRLEANEEDEWWEKRVDLPRQDGGEVKLKLAIKADRERDAEGNTNIYCASVSIMEIEPGLTARLANKGETSTAWTVTKYGFRSDSSPYQYIYFDLHDQSGESIEYLEDMNPFERVIFKSQVDDSLYLNRFTKEDCLLVYNSLVVIGVPEDVISDYGYRHGID